MQQHHALARVWILLWVLPGAALMLLRLLVVLGIGINPLGLLRKHMPNDVTLCKHCNMRNEDSLRHMLLVGLGYNRKPGACLSTRLQDSCHGVARLLFTVGLHNL